MRFSKLLVSFVSTLMLPPVQVSFAKPALPPAALPVPNHVVVVTEENHSYSEIIGSPQAPYINTLASEGSMVKPGKYWENINHYNVPRTLEAMYGLGYLGKAAGVKTITDVWQ